MTDFVKCQSGDRVASGDVFRLSFVPQSPLAFIPDTFTVWENWPEQMQAQLDALAGSPVYPVQGAPTVSANPPAGAFDVRAKSAAIGLSVQQVANIVEDSYSQAKLATMERLGAVVVDTGARAEGQTSAASSAGAQAVAGSFTAQLLGGLKVVAVIVVVVAVLVYIPKSRS